MIVPMYNAEIAPPKVRGLMAGMLQQMLSFGYVMANWIGYGASFLDSSAQWRLGLGLQIVWAVIVFLGLFFVPYSPWWLVQQGRTEEAKAALRALHFNGKNQDFLDKEFAEIHDSHQLDLQKEKATLKDLVNTVDTTANDAYGWKVRRMQSVGCCLPFSIYECGSQESSHELGEGSEDTVQVLWECCGGPPPLPPSPRKSTSCQKWVQPDGIASDYADLLWQ